MSGCSRCDVADSIHRRGPGNVVEVVHLTDKRGWTPCDIYVNRACFNCVPSNNWIWLNGVCYVWAMTVFSEEHSLDEDCALRRREDPKTVGFPQVRLKYEDGYLSGVGQWTWDRL